MTTPAAPQTPSPAPSTPGEELRLLIAAKIEAARRQLAAEGIEDSSEVLAHRVVDLLHADIRDEWDAIDIGTYGEPDRVLDQRWLMVKIPRESRDRKPNRSVSS